MEKPAGQDRFFDRVETWLEPNGKWILIFGWLGFLMLYCSLATDELGGVLGGDNARYLMLAKSLATGKGYRDLLFFGEPAHTQYPFMFPLLISPFAALSRQAFYTHLFIQVLASLIPLLLAAWARLEGSTRLKSLILFFLAASIPAYFAFLLNILTEIVFMFFMLGAFFILSHGRVRGFNIFKMLLFSLCILCSALTREAGLVLFGAVFIAIILDPALRKAKAGPVPFFIIYPAVFILGYGGWTIRNLTSGEGGIYFKQFFAKNPYLPQLGTVTAADLIQRIQQNKFLHVPHVGAFPFPSWLFSSNKSALAIGLIFFVVILIGIGYRLEKKNYAVEFSFLAQFGLAMIWFFQEERFSFALLPLAAFFFVTGLDFFEQKINALKPVFLVLLCALVLWQAGLTGWLAYKYHQPLIYPREPVEVQGYGTWSEPVMDFSKYNQYWQYRDQDHVGMADWIIMQKLAGKLTPAG